MCKTAIKAVIFLCSQSDKDEKVGLKQIAEAISSSEHTVGKILQSLVKEGIINSVKGPSGGFYLTKEQGCQPLIRIVEAIDGRDIFKECGLGLPKCSSSHPCPIHHLYEPIRSGMEKVFKEKKVCDLCHSVNIGEAYLAG